jgi:hypothetical protein
MSIIYYLLISNAIRTGTNQLMNIYFIYFYLLLLLFIYKCTYHLKTYIPLSVQISILLSLSTPSFGDFAIPIYSSYSSILPVGCSLLFRPLSYPFFPPILSYSYRRTVHSSILYIHISIVYPSNLIPPPIHYTPLRSVHLIPPLYSPILTTPYPIIAVFRILFHFIPFRSVLALCGLCCGLVVVLVFYIISYHIISFQ